MDTQNATRLYRIALDLTLSAIDSNTLSRTIADQMNRQYIVYTILHREAIFNIGDKIGVDARNRYIDHDMDKVIMYLWYTKKHAHDVHVALNEHHNRSTLNEDALIEMVLDWEQARFTKPDKPLNAYDTLYKYYADMESKIMPILVRCGLNNKTDYSEAIQKQQYSYMEKQITDDRIEYEIRQYIDRLRRFSW